MKYYLKENFHLLFADGTISDENGNVVYTYENQPVMFLPKISLYRDGEKIGSVEKTWTFIGASFDMYLHGEYIDNLRQKMKMFGTRLVFEQLGWSVEGRFGALHYEIYDRNNNLAAVLDQEIFRLTRRFEINILDEENEELIILLVVAINQFDRQLDSGSHAAAGNH
ncbi:MAG: hypothetical protein II712_03195 [Erysipelotrichaceae bacterium]|nr:hypothetical protein [Erysipelotrichaceae bacterium]